MPSGYTRVRHRPVHPFLVFNFAVEVQRGAKPRNSTTKNNFCFYHRPVKKSKETVRQHKRCPPGPRRVFRKVGFRWAKNTGDGVDSLNCDDRARYHAVAANRRGSGRSKFPKKSGQGTGHLGFVILSKPLTCPPRTDARCSGCRLCRRLRWTAEYKPRPGLPAKRSSAATA